MTVTHADARGSSGDLAGKRVLVLATEDWFVASHFLPLLRALVATGAGVAVAARMAGKRDVLAATGAKTIDFDFRRGELRPVQDAATALRLARLIRAERPDVVHAIALKPIALLSATAPLSNVRPALHLTGVGLSGTARGRLRTVAHAAVTRMVARTLARQDAWLFAENPDDVAALSRHRQIDPARTTILPGAGVDPSAYAVTPYPQSDPPSVGFVGRMIWSKGVDVLMEAQRRLLDDGLTINVRLCGEPDEANPRAVTRETLARWSEEPGVEWRGRVEDIAGFWRETAVAVVPSRGGEGLPRSLLEAAACARPAVVTDVPGCRQFVRDGVEGYVVPPGDPAALAGALRRLAVDRDLAERMGLAARQRVLGGYTETHVMNAIADAYRRLAA